MKALERVNRFLVCVGYDLPAFYGATVCDQLAVKHRSFPTILTVERVEVLRRHDRIVNRSNGRANEGVRRTYSIRPGIRTIRRDKVRHANVRQVNRIFIGTVPRVNGVILARFLVGEVIIGNIFRFYRFKVGDDVDLGVHVRYVRSMYRVRGRLLVYVVLGVQYGRGVLNVLGVELVLDVNDRAPYFDVIDGGAFVLNFDVYCDVLRDFLRNYDTNYSLMWRDRVTYAHPALVEVFHVGASNDYSARCKRFSYVDVDVDTSVEEKDDDVGLDHAIRDSNARRSALQSKVLYDDVLCVIRSTNDREVLTVKRVLRVLGRIPASLIYPANFPALRRIHRKFVSVKRFGIYASALPLRIVKIIYAPNYPAINVLFGFNVNGRVKCIYQVVFKDQAVLRLRRITGSVLDYLLVVLQDDNYTIVSDLVVYRVEGNNCDYFLRLYLRYRLNGVGEVINEDRGLPIAARILRFKFSIRRKIRARAVDALNRVTPYVSMIKDIISAVDKINYRGTSTMEAIDLQRSIPRSVSLLTIICDGAGFDKSRRFVRATINKYIRRKRAPSQVIIVGEI